jgi:hypothetical protein
VRRFTFVDERASYAARSGKANEKMGWIEVSVFREAGGHASGPRIGEDRAPSEDAGGAAAPAPETGAARAKPAAPKGVGAEGVELGRGRSYPGTGWGERSTDRAVVVEFEPHRRAAERITLRYEYAAALVELGVLPPVPGREDRLADREAGRTGFAPPPVR